MTTGSRWVASAHVGCGDALDIVSTPSLSSPWLCPSPHVRHQHNLPERKILTERCFFYTTPHALLGHRAEIPLHLCHSRRKRSVQHVSFCRCLCGMPPQCLAVNWRMGSRDRPHCISQLLLEFHPCGHVILNIQKNSASTPHAPRSPCPRVDIALRLHFVDQTSQFHLRSRSHPARRQQRPRFLCRVSAAAFYCYGSAPAVPFCCCRSDSATLARPHRHDPFLIIMILVPPFSM